MVIKKPSLFVTKLVLCTYIIIELDAQKGVF